MIATDAAICWNVGVTTMGERTLTAINRFNAAHPWDHNAHYHGWILRQLPKRFDSSLDVGCGTGDLARRLTSRADVVRGIDADPQIVARARELTSPAAPVTFTVADASTTLPSGPYDVITCVAALHHLPFVETLTRFRAHLAPGGTLVVVGLTQDSTRTEHLLGVVSIPANLAMGWVKHRGRAGTKPVAMSARARPAQMHFPDVLREARQVLPGARLHRRLFWRYTLVWRKNQAGQR
ncbi:class I SAM-dependent methyltransferase [Actinopolymorpha pittospori]